MHTYRETETSIAIRNESERRRAKREARRAALAAAYQTGGLLAVIRFDGLNPLGNCEDSAVWCAAMTAHYGPLMHPSRLGADGRPSAETLRDCPRVAEDMAAARDRLGALLGIEVSA